MTLPIPMKEVEVYLSDWERLETIRRRIKRRRQREQTLQNGPDIIIDPDPTYTTMADVIEELLDTWEFQKSPRRPHK